MKLSFQRARAKGFSLIELLLVLGILAVFLITAFVFYPQVRDRNQANTEVANLTSIKANINNLYAAKGGNYNGLTSPIANQARAYPSSMNGGVFTSGATITSAWGQPVVAEASTGTAPRTFTVTYTAVPAGVCLGLVSGAAGNFQDITVGGSSVFSGTPLTLNPTTAAIQCANGGTVVFTSN